MKYKFVLWDFDGTLADSLGCLLRIYNGLAPRHGFRLIDDPAAVRNLTLLPLLRKLGIPLRKLPGLMHAVLVAQRLEMPSVQLFPELLPALQSLQQAGCRVGVLSSNSRENILACLRANQAESLFESVVGYRRLFGKGRAIQSFLKKQGLLKPDVLYVGDEVRDVEAARKAGIAVAAVVWGANTRELLASHKPDFLLDHPGQILTVLASVPEGGISSRDRQGAGAEDFAKPLPDGRGSDGNYPSGTDSLE